jgi:hypothetical protein
MFVSRKLFLAAAAATTLGVSSIAGAQATQLASQPIPIALKAFPSHPGNPTVQDAKRLFDEGHWREAKKAYESAIDDARDRGDYAPEALAGLANLKYIMDDVRGAALAFDELGQQAAKFGDPETELTAYFNSALLFQEVKDGRNAAVRVPRIKALLKSPVISAQTREMVAKRVV